MTVRELRERLERMVGRVFPQGLRKPLSASEERYYYQLSFLDGQVMLFVPEEELVPEVQNFLDLTGNTGLVIPGCLFYLKDPDATSQSFWRIVRDGNFRPVLNYSNPANVFRRYAYDKEKRRCFAIVRFDSKDTAGDADRLLYPDHLRSVPGNHLGLSSATLYEIISL